MARKMKKFADGGSDKYKARYDRKVADIESDYKKAQGRKTGRDAEVAKAKYEQRMADAKDDLAKWTKSDRTATRAAESAAEKNLSMTRKFGARSSEGLVAKAEDKLADKAPLSSVNVPAASAPKAGMSFKDAFAAARKAGDKTFKWNGKSFTTQIKGEASKVSRPAPKVEGKPAAKVDGKPKATVASGLVVPASLALASRGKTAAPAPGQRFADEVEKTKGLYKAKGGKVKKFNKGGSTAEDKRRSVLGSDKDIIARGNRTPYEPIPKTGPDKPKSKPLGRAGKAGFKSGGSVMKKGMDGVAKKGHTKGMMPKMACGGKMKGYAKGGSIDGIAMKGKTRCKGAK